MFVIICEHYTNIKTASVKSGASKPIEKNIEVSSYDIYRSNFSRPDPLMKACGGTERMYRSYTPEGFICTTCVCISPDRQVRSVREFFVYSEEDLKKKAPAEHIKALEDYKKRIEKNE